MLFIFINFRTSMLTKLMDTDNRFDKENRIRVPMSEA